jgi:hypothetical protein
MRLADCEMTQFIFAAKIATTVLAWLAASFFMLCFGQARQKIANGDTTDKQGARLSLLIWLVSSASIVCIWVP